MLKLNKSKSGFSLVEIVVATGVVAFIVIVGWLVYSRYDKSNAALILQRQQHIDKYISHLSVQNYTDLGSSLYKSGYLTSSLYKTTQSLTNSYTNGGFTNGPPYSAIICIDEIPKSYAYGAVNFNSTDSAATVPVKVFTYDSLPTSYTASWLKTGGTWQLNKVSCSPD